MDLQVIPRTIVNRSLDLARLPYDTAARVFGRGNEWPPIIAVDRVDATVRDAAGRLLRDERLVADARLLRTETEERERAVRLRTDAARVERKAEQREAARTRSAEQQRDQARKAEQQRTAAAERERRRAEARIEQEAADAKRAEREGAAQREEAVRRKE